MILESYIPVILIFAGGFIVDKFTIKNKEFNLPERIALWFGLGLLIAAADSFILGWFKLLFLLLPVSVVEVLVPLALLMYKCKSKERFGFQVDCSSRRGHAKNCLSGSNNHMVKTLHGSKFGMNKKVFEVFDGKTVLVTGGAGAIGSNLVKTLSTLETKKIIILDDFSSSYEWNIPASPKVAFIKGSILDDEKLKWAFKEKPQIVYHLAAHFANQNSVDNPETDLMVNGMGTLKVLEHAHLVGVERFIYASSGCGIYGADSKMPFEEHDISMKLYTPYQVTKMLGELYTNYYYNLYHLPIVNARFFNLLRSWRSSGKIQKCYS